MTEIKTYQMYTNGSWLPAAGGEWFDAINPYSREVWAHIPQAQEEDADQTLAAADGAFAEWANLGPSRRGKLLFKLADELERAAKHLAAVEVRDNGKRFAEMLGQMRMIPRWWRYYAGLADKIEGAVLPNEDANILNYSIYEPLGVVLAITPWNSPLFIASLKLAPALAAGNTTILKPSEHTSASSLEFAEIVDKVGFPPGVFNVLTGFGAEIGQYLAQDRRVAKISFTGGEAGGKAVYRQAAERLSTVCLELGGKSPNIIFADANLDNAVNGAIGGIFNASGQTCIAGSRLLVQQSVYDQVIKMIVERCRDLRLGDPMSPETQVGPVATEDQLNKILSYVDIAKAEGARCVMGGEAATGDHLGNGLFAQPTVFSHVANTMQIAQEEIFGPVLCVIPFADEAEAVSIANDTRYGLGAGVWTEDVRRIHRMTRAIKSGMVWVNMYRAINYVSPFGGYKNSGIGRENGIEAIKEFLQVKAVWINNSETVPFPF